MQRKFDPFHHVTSQRITNPLALKSIACAAVLVGGLLTFKSAFADENKTDKGLPPPAALGVFLSQVADAVNVVEVVPGSPAERAGIVVGDEIRFIDDQRIRTTQELTDEISANRPGTQVDLMIRRDGRRQIVHAELAGWESTFGNRDRSLTNAGGRSDGANRGQTTGQGPGSYAYRSYSYGSTNGSAFTPLQIERGRMRMLEQRISRLQQEINALRYRQQVYQPMADDDWWERVRHGETNNDPALFQ